MLKLPDVTLVIAETRSHALASRTVNDIASRVQFGDILIYSDKNIAVPGARHIPVEDWRDKITSGRFYYTEAATRINTSHALLMEWDAGLNDPGMWSDEFLQYDYIGAPWIGDGHPNTSEGRNVGNGGFLLLSKRLADYAHENRERIEIVTDVHFSCYHRRQLEAEGGFLWAPYEVAERFAFEGWDFRDHRIDVPVRPKSFGYHGVFNWEWALSKSEIIERTRLLIENKFLRRAKLGLLFEYSPWLSAEVSQRLKLIRTQGIRA